MDDHEWDKLAESIEKMLWRQGTAGVRHVLEIVGDRAFKIGLDLDEAVGGGYWWKWYASRIERFVKRLEYPVLRTPKRARDVPAAVQ